MGFDEVAAILATLLGHFIGGSILCALFALMISIFTRKKLEIFKKVFPIIGFTLFVIYATLGTLSALSTENSYADTGLVFLLDIMTQIFVFPFSVFVVQIISGTFSFLVPVLIFFYFLSNNKSYLSETSKTTEDLISEVPVKSKSAKLAYSKFFWPSKITEQPNAAQRAGRVIHWAFCGIATMLLIWSVFTVGQPVELPPSRDYPLRQQERIQAEYELYAIQSQATPADAAPNWNEDSTRQAEQRLQGAIAAEERAKAPGLDMGGWLFGIATRLALVIGCVLTGRSIRYVLAGE
jgi:hypothetical protein